MFYKFYAWSSHHFENITILVNNNDCIKYVFLYIFCSNYKVYSQIWRGNFTWV